MFKEIPVSSLDLSRRSLVCGMGVNDADYKVMPRINGVQVVCPIYQIWSSMIKRCYSKKVKEKQKAYDGCKVCDEWLRFSNFKDWASDKYIPGLFLDKDIKGLGKKVYSPDNCLFVSRKVNNFVKTNLSGDINYSFSYSKKKNKYMSYGRNPISGKQEYFGSFDSKEDALSESKKRKVEYLEMLIESEHVGSKVIADALRKMLDA